MATLTIYRTNEYNNKLRAYKIFIDGQLAGTINNGEEKPFATTPGPHVVTAKIDWCSSPEVSLTLAAGENKNLKVGGFTLGRWILPVITGITVLHFIIWQLLKFNYLIFLLAPLLLVMVYYVTLGRKKYLTLHVM